MDLVFVHGAFVRDGGWWWEAAGRSIEQATGVRSHAVALPSCAGDGEAGRTGEPAGLTQDALALRGVLDGLDDAIVVAHSYGGTVAAEGAAHPALRHLVYISSFLPEPGQAQAELPAAEDPVAVRDNLDGTVSLDADDRDAFVRRFMADVTDAGVVEQALARLTAQSVLAFGTPTTTAAWRTVESTYLVCTEDRSTRPALQRQHAARATRTVELPTGHHPFLSHPELVAEQLVAIIRAATR